MKACSSIAATMVLGVLLTVSVPVAATQSNSNATVQMGQINITRTSQCGEENTNSTYQDGRVNINQTNQGGCRQPERGARGRAPGHEGRAIGPPAHAAAGRR